MPYKELQSAVASFNLHRLDCRSGGLPDSRHCTEFFPSGIMSTMKLSFVFFFFLEALYKGLNAIMFRTLIPGMYLFLIKFATFHFGGVCVCVCIKPTEALMEIPAWYLYAVLYDWSIGSYVPEGVTNFTDNTVFKQVSRFSSQFCMFFGMLNGSTSIKVFFIDFVWRKPSPHLENTEWKGKYGGA